MNHVREQVLAYLGACGTRTLPEIYESIPKFAQGAVRKALMRLVNGGEVERLERGMYRLKQAPPPLRLPVSSGFIPPIPKSRLMAGRA